MRKLVTYTIHYDDKLTDTNKLTVCLEPDSWMLRVFS